MKNNQKGFIGIPVLLVGVLVLLAGGGIYLTIHEKPTQNTSVVSTTTNTSEKSTLVQESTQIKTYTNSQYGFSFEYPVGVQINTTPTYSKNDWWYPNFTNPVNLVSSSYNGDLVLFMLGTSSFDVANCGRNGKSSNIGGVNFSSVFGNKGGFEGSEYKLSYEARHNNICYKIVISQSKHQVDNFEVLDSIVKSFRFTTSATESSLSTVDVVSETNISVTKIEGTKVIFNVVVNKSKSCKRSEYKMDYGDGKNDWFEVKENTCLPRIVTYSHEYNFESVENSYTARLHDLTNVNYYEPAFNEVENPVASTTFKLSK